MSNPAWRPGMSSPNPTGRPKSSLRSVLDRELRRRLESERGKLPATKLVACHLLDLVTKGKTTLEGGKVIEVRDLTDYLAVVSYVAGPPPSQHEVELSGSGGMTILWGMPWPSVEAPTTASET